MNNTRQARHRPHFRPQEAPQSLQPTGMILVVDDSKLQHRASRLILEPAGYAVTSCSSAVEALGYLVREPVLPDLIITDLVRRSSSRRCNIQLPQPPSHAAGWLAAEEDPPQSITKAHPPARALPQSMPPGLSGFEFILRVRSVWPAAKLPIIVSTSSNDVEDLDRCLMFEANDFVRKARPARQRPA